MNTVKAAGEILNIYQTGDRPILVLCSDGYHYICKYKQPGLSANRLVSEMLGSAFAQCWRIATPLMAMVGNDPIIWSNAGVSHDPTAPLLGSRKMENVLDLNEMFSSQIKVSFNHLHQLLWIALFDFWLANEDRTSNNYNLLYDLKKEEIVSIDYGGIFNSGIISAPFYQLNKSDSIIDSALFERLKDNRLEQLVRSMHFVYQNKVSKCRIVGHDVIKEIPNEWNVNSQIISSKVEELFDNNWINDTWNNFKEIVLG